MYDLKMYNKLTKLPLFDIRLKQICVFLFCFSISLASDNNGTSKL